MNQMEWDLPTILGFMPWGISKPQPWVGNPNSITIITVIDKVLVQVWRSQTELLEESSRQKESHKKRIPEIRILSPYKSLPREKSHNWRQQPFFKIFLETRSHYVTQAGLEFVTSYLSLRSARTVGVSHWNWLKLLMKEQLGELYYKANNFLQK